MECVAKPGEAKACPAVDKPLILQVHDGGHNDQQAAAAAANDKQAIAQATDNHVKAGNLPELTIGHAAGAAIGGAAAGAAGEAAAKAAAPPEHHWYTGALNVAEDIGKGAVDEVIHHPLRVVESFAIGAATAAVASVVATPVAIAATVAGVGYGAYQIYKHAPGWIHAAEELNHPENFNAKELSQAHQTWQNFGGGATDLAAAIGGGIAYRAASSAISQAMEDAADAHPVKTAAAGSAANNDGGASSQAATPGDGGASGHGAAAAGPNVPGDGGASAHAGMAAGSNVPGDGGISGHQAAAIQGSAGHHLVAGAQIVGNPNGTEGGADGIAGAASTEASTTTPEVLNPLAIGEKAPILEKPVLPEVKPVPEVVKPLPEIVKPLPEVAAPAMTPEEAALANSVKASQGIFNDAMEDGGKGVVESTKQLYNVRFEKVTEDAGRRLFTLENRSEGVLVPKGAFIATRLDAAGNPVIEDGIQNSWSMQAAKIGKTYQVDPETLANTEKFVAPTRVDGPSVHMVQLDKATEIMTKWGAMKAKIGDWLANYDFDKTGGKPGGDYAIVSGESYKQTYQPKPKL